MKFSYKITQDKNKLNKFLNSSGYHLDQDKEFIYPSKNKKGIFIICTKEFDEDLVKVANLFFPVSVLNGFYTTNDIATVFLNDSNCFITDLMGEEIDKTKEWLDFLTQQFGYEFVNKHNKKIKEYNKKLEQKNENSRTF